VAEKRKRGNGDTKKLADQIRKRTDEPLEKRKVKDDFIDPNSLIPTGSMLLNLACSDMTDGGWQLGKMVNLIGDSSSGKSFIGLSLFAECAQLERFDNHRFIYDDVEAANEFDLEYLFGERTAERVEPPAYDKDGDDAHSNYIQDFHDNILTAMEGKKPFIYILDSFDALDALEDEKKIEEARTERKKGKEAAGTYGLAKAKAASSIFRNIISKLKKSNSFLLVISQTRDNISPMSFVKKTRSGGKALKFYAQHEIWLAVVSPFTKTIDKKKYTIGVKVKAKVSKNKLTGRTVADVEFPIYYDYGIDSIQAGVDYAEDNSIWEKEKESFITYGLNPDDPQKAFKGTKASIIKHIEENGYETQLAAIVAKKWHEIKEALKSGRKRKYA